MKKSDGSAISWSQNRYAISDASGAALLITLIALSLFSLLGIYMALNATTSVHISDNYESQLQATYAAQAGLNHARVLIRRMDFDNLLQGPDGTYDGSSSYRARAKSYEFRNLLSLSMAHSLNIFDPAQDVSGIPDDGLISTGAYGAAPGTVLIPATGIVQVAPNPYGPGDIVTSRYFAKVTDNNKETSEVTGDSDDNPFIDGDGVIIVRSMGLAQTISDITGSVRRRNSVAVYEARLKRFSAFDLDVALAVQGSQVHASFDGSCEISGGSFPGIGTIDTNPSDDIFPDQIIRAAAGEGGTITGGELPNPSIQDLTGQISADSDQSALLDPQFLWDFVNQRVQRAADDVYGSDQFWSGATAPYAGHYDTENPLNAPEQDPRLIIVNGDLTISGNFSGGGLLIVTGSFAYAGPFSYNGLILVIGSGNITADGSGSGISGGLFIANLSENGGNIGFGISSLSINGNSRIVANNDAVKMALGLIPPSQISFREIAGSDP